MGRVGAMVALAFALTCAACSSFQPKLNGGEIERAIEQSARTQFAGASAVIGKAHCPRNRVQRKNDRFDCHVAIDGQDAIYVVTQVDGHGTVQPTLASHYLLFSTINDETLADLRVQGVDRATVACGYAHVWIVTPPISRDCVVTLPDHSTHTAHVSLAADGGVSKVVVAGLNS